MTKKDKLIQKLLSKPSDFNYDEAKSLLSKLGYKEDFRGKTSGSRVAFVNSETGHIIRFHKPHPNNQLKYYQVEQLIEELRKQGAI
ncbi:MAG TPA: type II toxin-antitoxin system HicA family toxin [Tepidanaerobacteraceae bacterium]|jgi:ABC-type transport system substrate-binding protein|nr:type II toxin-antitoxin system HicA family toxin [Tepidanaerobacteraceae bacterium]